MTAPRPIEGSVGSRIRIVFGATGEDWLLLLNEDDGNRVWQTHQWSGCIPNKVATQLNNCSNKGRYVREVDFDHRTGSWYVNGIKRDGTGDHSWWNCDRAEQDLKDFVGGPNSVKVTFGTDVYGEESYVLLKGRNGYVHHGIQENLANRISRINKRKKKINFIRLFGNESYFISDDEGTEWDGCCEYVTKELKGNLQTEDLAVAGDGCWVIVHPNSYVASTGVSSTLTQHLARFYREQKERGSQRSREIREYHDRIRREEQERAAAETARVAQEALEREERERAERLVAEAAAREEAERIAREEAERFAREEAERAAREQAAQRALWESELQNQLEERLIEEAKDVKELETHLEKRKRSLQSSLEKIPAARRARIHERSSTVSLAPDDTGSDSVSTCVVCHDRAKERAVTPCGHHCLCDQCVDRVVSNGNKCPVCRAVMQGTLRIYMS